MARTFAPDKQTDPQSEKLDPRVQQSYEAVSRTLEETPIGKLLTNQERTALSLPLGAWSTSPQIEPRWESFGTLLWSLGIVSHIPDYHSPYPREILFKATGIIPAHPSTVINFTQHFDSHTTTTTLVPPDSFMHEVNRAEAWYWRSKAQVLVDLQTFLKRDGPDVEQAKKKIPQALQKSLQTLPTALSQASLRAHQDGLIPSRIKDDFGVGDVPYAELGHHDLGLVASIAQDRLAALGWLAGVREWDVGKDEEVPFVNPLGSLWTPKE
ncbi:hypothetical protein HK097_003626 [Rhizophlyctis rosea]|uniref:Uncharacterized protein n=1 Tax=Rhizophlyctis rosea TaxID=64517 RepID=A0AAD5S3W6_9FUNG|nr:hypothetical protein HK097_003626 [Rhizophlyctis rosea]